MYSRTLLQTLFIFLFLSQITVALNNIDSTPWPLPFNRPISPVKPPKTKCEEILFSQCPFYKPECQGIPLQRMY